MNLRTRFALVLAGLAGVSAALVGVVGHRITSLSFRNEIEHSLNDFATRLALQGGADATRYCSPRGFRNDDAASPGVRARPPFPGSADGDVAGPLRRRLAPPVAIVVQCLDRTGEIILAPRLFNLPVNAAERKIALAKRGTKSTRTVTIDERRYLLVTVAVEPTGAIQIARELSENTRVLSSLVLRFGFLVLASTAIAGLAGLWLARRTTRPLAALTAATEEIAAQGHLDVPLPETQRTDETGRLTRSFSMMVDALRTSKSQQTQLVYDAGHELRTPITSLRTNIGVLRRHKDLPPEKRSELFDDMHAELSELTSLVEELVALAADSEADDPIGAVDLADTVAVAVERWRRRSGCAIVISSDSEATCEVNGRSRMLARAVSNLLSNAVKFSPENSPIDVEVRCGDSHIMLTIRDSGAGIPIDDLPKIFDRFYRSTIHRDHPGSGLGLAIVASAATSHGGTITAANNTDGPGATFTLTLPLGGVSNRVPGMI